MDNVAEAKELIERAKKKSFYRCINRHEVDHGINKADEGLRCPECGDHLIFSIKEISPTVIKIKALKKIYYSDGWNEAQGLGVGFGLSLSVFDRPEEFTLTHGPNEEVEYVFEYPSYIPSKTTWDFPLKEAEVALLKFDWQGKKKSESSRLWKQPMETVIQSIKGKNKATSIAACKTITLAAESVVVRLNANFCAWLIGQF